METHSDDFNELRKLLALKRHEQPPPRFFNEFSARVIERLQTPEVLPQPTWWQRLGLDFDLRPAMVCALGVVISGLLLFGVISGVDTDSSTTGGFAMSASSEVGQAGWMGLPVLAAVSNPNFNTEETSPALVFGSSASQPFSFSSQPAARLRL